MTLCRQWCQYEHCTSFHSQLICKKTKHVFGSCVTVLPENRASIPGLRLLSDLDLFSFLGLPRSLTFAQSKGWELALRCCIWPCWVNWYDLSIVPCSSSTALCYWPNVFILFLLPGLNKADSLFYCNLANIFFILDFRAYSRGWFMCSMAVYALWSISCTLDSGVLYWVTVATSCLTSASVCSVVQSVAVVASIWWGVECGNLVWYGALESPAMIVH